MIIGEHHTWSCHGRCPILGRAGCRSCRYDRMLRRRYEPCIGDITLREMWKVRTAGGENPPCEEDPDRRGGRRLLRHDVLFDGEADEICRAAKAQNLKQLSFVILDSADRDIELGGDLFHALAFR